MPAYHYRLGPDELWQLRLFDLPADSAALIARLEAEPEGEDGVLRQGCGTHLSVVRLTGIGRQRLSVLEALLREHGLQLAPPAGKRPAPAV